MGDTFLKAGRALCYTSIEDTRSSLTHISDIRVVKAALMYERSGMKRATMIRMLESKIRRMEKEALKHEQE
ncbi:hypothetical protein [uncultured Desulfobacter sp.]|uniref:hypothetical protein n=1 Tax=uncultured Desulfobacter sp. TaxID=240139 RepID=UPI002AAA817E|nr:hypothetical protein [uncultured Desulfobacter sp.]